MSTSMINSSMTSLEENHYKTRQCIKKYRHNFADKAMFFFSSHAQVWGLGHKEGWVTKNCYFWIVVLEKTLESPLDSKGIKTVNPKDQPWIVVGRTDVEAEAPILWPSGEKSRVIGKDPDVGKGWGEMKGATEDEIVE